MEKKQYNTPSMEMAALTPTTIICASITKGSNTEDISGDPVGD